MSLDYPTTSQEQGNIPNPSESGTGTKGQQWGTPIAPTSETEEKILAIQDALVTSRGGRWPKTLLLSMGIDALSRELGLDNLVQASSQVNTPPLTANVVA